MHEYRSSRNETGTCMKTEAAGMRQEHSHQGHEQGYTVDKGIKE
jgi:hypothetical protein